MFRTAFPRVPRISLYTFLFIVGIIVFSRGDWLRGSFLLAAGFLGFVARVRFCKDTVFISRD